MFCIVLCDISWYCIVFSVWYGMVWYCIGLYCVNCFAHCIGVNHGCFAVMTYKNRRDGAVLTTGISKYHLKTTTSWTPPKHFCWNQHNCYQPSHRFANPGALFGVQNGVCLSPFSPRLSLSRDSDWSAVSILWIFLISNTEPGACSSLGL